MNSYAAQNTPVELTPSAIQRIGELLSQEKAPYSAFRVAVDGGGCSGFQYRFVIEYKTPAPQDIVLERGAARVLIDDVSMQFLNGSVLDYVEDMAGASFAVKNPNSTARCGCGNSFSVT